MSDFRISQIKLFGAITREIERQAKQAGLGKTLNVEVYQMDAIAKAATAICEEFSRAKKDSHAGMGLQNWLASDDTGMSSKAMAARLCGVSIPTRDRNFHPLDGADFGRCHRFLEAVPDCRARLSNMADVSPVWAKLIAAWDELTALYLEELPTGKAPKLYAKMREIEP